MINALIFSGALAALLLAARASRAREQGAVAMSDPQRDPNYCWTHQMIWPACEGMH